MNLSRAGTAIVATALTLGLVSVAVAVTLTSVAVAGSDVAKQRVTMTTQGSGGTYRSPMVLAPRQAGTLERESGTLTASSLDSDRVVMRHGQRVEIHTAPATFKGKRGSFVIGARTEYVDAGNGYHIGTGTWKIVRGTGKYAGMTGGGRTGHVWLESGPWSSHYEGILTLP